MASHEKKITKMKDLFSFLPSRTVQRVYYRGEAKEYSLLPKLNRKLTSPDGEAIKRRYGTTDTVEIQGALLQRFRRYASHYHKGGEDRPVVGRDPKPDKPEPNRVLRAPTVAAAGEVPGVSPEMES